MEASFHKNCTPHAINEFPTWLVANLPEYQYTIISCDIVLIAYLMLALSIVCSEFFIPALERLCYKRKLSYNVAGATFLTISTSAPELIVQVVGTFMTDVDSDIGILIGSAVFNLLGVGALCGLVIKSPMSLDWWPITRDLMWYIVACIILVCVIHDTEVTVLESLFMVLLYAIILIKLIWDETIQGLVRSTDAKHLPCFKPIHEVPDLIGRIEEDPQETYHEQPYNPWKYPKEGSGSDQFFWLTVWPVQVIFYLTIPDCRNANFRKRYLLQLIVTTFWIGGLSYLIGWVMTIVGSYFLVPDAIMRITFLAIGTSIPEAVTSIVVAIKGYGSMAMCNAISSNTYDILICSGLPWLVKAAMDENDPSAITNYVFINSRAMSYEIISLLAAALLLYISFLITRFTLDRIFGFIQLAGYMFFIWYSCTAELNTFGFLSRKLCENL